MLRAVRGRRFGGPAAVVAALVLVAGSSAACSSSGSTGGGAGSGGSGSFKDVLKNIHDVAQTDDYIEYGDTAVLVKANGGASPGSNGPFTRLIGLGAEEYSDYTQVLPPVTGFDSTAASSAIEVGKPPYQVSILYGSFDPAAIGAKLAAWGYHKQDRGDGVTAWVFQEDHKLGVLDPNTGIGPGMMGWLNVVWVSKTSIAYGGATSDLVAALPAQSKPLADDAVVSQLADCLGSPLGAIVATDQSQIKNPQISAVAFGVTGTGAADARLEICVAAPSAPVAQSFAKGFTSAVTSGLDYKANEPWSDKLSDPQTAVLGGSAHVVRLTAKPVTPDDIGLMVTLVYEDDYATLLGQPQVVRTGGGGSVTVSPTSS